MDFVRIRVDADAPIQPHMAAPALRYVSDLNLGP